MKFGKLHYVIQVFCVRGRQEDGGEVNRGS